MSAIDNLHHACNVQAEKWITYAPPILEMEVRTEQRTRRDVGKNDFHIRNTLVLGGARGGRLTAKARMAGCKARTARANGRAADIAAIVAELQASGSRSLRSIAAGLNERGIPTATGAGGWQAAQVRRVLARVVHRCASVG